MRGDAEAGRTRVEHSRSVHTISSPTDLQLTCAVGRSSEAALNQRRFDNLQVESSYDVGENVALAQHPSTG
jgi:hypothetical protein